MKGRIKVTSALVFLATIGTLAEGAERCRRMPESCKDESCVETWECQHGVCGPDGGCSCHPCYSGTLCDNYINEHKPQFPMRTAQVNIAPGHTGSFFKLSASDRDAADQCPNNQFIGPETCPCGHVMYSFRLLDPADQDAPFSISDKNEVIIEEKSNAKRLETDQTYILEISATNPYEVEESLSSASSFQLTVSVVLNPEATDAEENMRLIQEMDEGNLLELVGNNKENYPLSRHTTVSRPKRYANETVIGYNEEPLPLDMMSQSLPSSGSHIRQKREVAGPGVGDTTITLAVDGTDPSTLYPGHTVDYIVTIHFPTLGAGDNFDFIMEVFVMDPVSGITTLAICDLTIDAFPADVTATNQPPTPDFQKNLFLPTITDRVILDFGVVTNGDTNTGDPTLSQVVVRFSVTMISNLAYTNATAIVTAGAEYSSQTYVWVSQADYPFDSDPGFTYPPDITISGPDTVPEYGGASFAIDAIITDPTGPFIFEVYTPMDMHNLFTVSQMSLIVIGSNLKCTGEPLESRRMYYSVDHLTYHRGTITFNFFMSDLVYPNLIDELTDPNNKIQLGASILLKDAKDGDIVSVGLGISVGLTTVWTALANITVTANVAPTAGAATWDTNVLNLGTNRNVPPNGILTYGLQVTIPPGANAQLTCTIPAVADQKVVGVVWGSCDLNVVTVPFLERFVTYNDDGSATFLVDANSTNQVTGADTCIVDVSIQYLTSTITDVPVDCGGTTLTLTGGVTTANVGIEDVSGTAEPPTADDVWYHTSQQALIVKLNFPKNGVPYEAFDIQVSGDFDVTAFGAEICDLRVLHAGKGMPTFAARQKEIYASVVYNKSSDTALYEDAAEVSVGPVARVDLGADSTDDDGLVVIRAAYHFPRGQVFSAVPFNLSMGIKLGSSVIWTGWQQFTVSTSDPAYVPQPLLALVPLTTEQATVVPGQPTIVFYKFKSPPGMVHKVIITATVPSLATLSICRVNIVAIGANYPCLDQHPHGKHIENPNHVNTIIHDVPPNYGASVVVDMGILKNLGWDDYYADEIADDDSIVLGFVVKGVAAGLDTLTISTDVAGTVTPLTADITVAGALVPTGALVSAVWSDGGTSLGYSNLMKIFELEVIVEHGYSGLLSFTFDTANLPEMELCFVTVKEAGENLPCVLPHEIIPIITVTTTSQTHQLDINACYYGFKPFDLNENRIIFMVGTQLTKAGIGSGEVSLTITENAVASAVTVTPYVVTRSPTPFDGTGLNTTTEGFMAYVLDNSTVLVAPGESYYYGIGVLLPKFSTGEVEVGVMTPTLDGRALATVHNWTWGEYYGSNVGCLMDEINYEFELMQNSSIDIPMIHESQTDTMVIKLGYLTNTGISYSHGVAVPLDDDRFEIAFEIMMADHHAVADATVIPISIAVKFHDVIYVISKELTILRTAATDAMSLRTYMNFTTPYAVSPIFSRASNDKIDVTIQMSHYMNISRMEANDAIIRILMPNAVRWVNGSDTLSVNITHNAVENHYLDINITNLFFTDYIEINLTLSVDPLNDMPKGLGLLDAALLVRLVCTNYHDQTTVRYCGTSMVLPFSLEGTECFDPLNVTLFTACQFHASSSIDSTSSPASSITTGWSPAMRTGTGWTHYLYVDFLRKTRVTRLEFTAVAGKRSLATFKLDYSFTGSTFTPACPDVLTVTSNVIELPPNCRFEARFMKITLLSGTGDPLTPYGIKFLEIKGCPQELVLDTCLVEPVQLTTDPGWRQIAYDTTNAVAYFCDYSPVLLKSVCYSSADGSTWNAMPGYITSLIGEDPATGLFYATDATGLAVVSSADGISWSVADSAILTTLTATAVSVPGNAPGSFGGPYAAGPYTADYYGLSNDGGATYKVKWESCCP